VSLRPAPAVGRPEAGSSAAAVIVVGVPEPGRVHVLDPIEPVWSRLKRSLANLTKHDIAELTALVKTRLKRMQYRPGLLAGFLASTGLEFGPSCNSRP
jgi:hypothetical protein